MKFLSKRLTPPEEEEILSPDGLWTWATSSALPWLHFRLASLHHHMSQFLATCLCLSSHTHSIGSVSPRNPKTLIAASWDHLLNKLFTLEPLTVVLETYSGWTQVRHEQNSTQISKKSLPCWRIESFHLGRCLFFFKEKSQKTQS